MGHGQKPVENLSDYVLAQALMFPVVYKLAHKESGNGE